MSQPSDQQISDDVDGLILPDPKAVLAKIRELASTCGEQSFSAQLRQSPN
jgi:hypothetical protein